MPVYFSKQELEHFGAKMESYRGELFKEEYLPKVRAFPKVRRLFERLKQDKKQISLASSAKKDELEKYQEIAQIGDLIDSEISSDDVEKSKPCPNVFNVARHQLGIDPENVAVVGDTTYDAEAATKARLRSIGMLCGDWTQSQLHRAGCIAIYRDPADLLTRSDASPLGSQKSLAFA